MQQVCPSCGQSTRYLRFGVLLPPVKCEIVDAIKAAGELGISSEEIVYKNPPPELFDEGAAAELILRAKRNVKVHIWQINEKLAETKYSIVSSERRWRLHKGR